jgi:DNA-binding CsgD family transcriptional regulator
MTAGIVGREQELERVHAFLDSPADGASALVLEGEAGIGKSTLWAAGVEHARERGYLLLTSRPAEAERGFAGLGLADLLEGSLGDVLPGLAPPRRRALEQALLLEDASGGVVDHRALAVAVRDVLQLLGEGGPLVIAVDDVQWLDPASATVLAFALRRVEADSVLVLLARRLGEGAGPTELEQALEEERVRRLGVGPLSVGALHRLLHDRLDRPFARQTLLRIHERSGGNPFFALELARVLDADVDPLQPLPVPESLEELVRERLAALPEATREALALASAFGTPSTSLLERAGIVNGALGAGVDANVIEVDGETVRFTHPLLSSVLYHDLGERRRSVHGLIAEIAQEPLLRARHLALSRDRPDDEVARILDAASRVAAYRGAPAVASELAEQALRLTPSKRRDERRRRAIAAAHAEQATGEWTRARTITTELLAEPELGSLRPEVLILRAELESVDRSVALLEEALRDPGADPALRFIVHCRLAWATRFNGGSEHARAAHELAEEIDDDVLRAQARAIQSILNWFTNEGETPDDLPHQMHDFAVAVGGEHLVREATQAIANTFAPSSEREVARGLFEHEYREWRDRDEPRSARALWALSWVEFWTGRWELGADYAARAFDISIQYGLEVPQDHLPIAVIDVHRGLLEVASRHSEQALELAEKQFPGQLHPPQHMAVLGLAALWSGDTTAARDWLGKADRRAAELGWKEPSVRWWSGDHAELLLESGRIGDAVRIIDAWEADAERVGRDWVRAHVTRCRGLVAAAEGDLERSALLLQQALEEHELVGDPYGHARALLALGVVLRRTRKKRAARDAIEEALEGFERLPAETWAARARDELGRIGGRRREEGLTAAERRVAVLVAQGQTNREVAAALFLGERTVASHLTHIYSKLGIRSRTELARRLD